MADDWQVGDLALCVNAGPLRDICGDGGIETARAYVLGLRVGCIYTVTHVVRCHCGKHIGLGAQAERVGGVADRFRKIRPHTPDQEDRETIALLTGVPVAEPVS
jgi:hypothetical protein